MSLEVYIKANHHCVYKRCQQCQHIKIWDVVPGLAIAQTHLSKTEQYLFLLGHVNRLNERASSHSKGNRVRLWLNRNFNMAMDIHKHCL